MLNYVAYRLWLSFLDQCTVEVATVYVVFLQLVFGSVNRSWRHKVRTLFMSFVSFSFIHEALMIDGARPNQLDVTKLHPLSHEVISRQTRINIGTDSIL